jgi:cyclic pyranopterin phosphate synthase
VIKNRAAEIAELIPEPRSPGDVAQVYRLEGGVGKIGFISSLSQSFCSDCSRIRMRSDGVLRLCLHGETCADLRTPLRRGASKRELIRLIQEAVQLKPAGHTFSGTREDEPAAYMCQLGG